MTQNLTKNLTKEVEYEYVAKAKTNPDYTGLVIESFTPLIKSIAKPYRRQNIDNRDLFQQGVLGIIRAIQDFDPERDMRFATLARWWVRAHIREFFLEQSKAFSISGALTTELNKIIELENTMSQELSRPVTIEELAEAKGISPKRLMYLYKHRSQPRSIFERLSDSNGDDSGQTLGDALADDHIDSPSERLIRTDSVEHLRAAIKRLTAREQFIIMKRYDLDGNGKFTLEELGKELGMTLERVRQIQAKAEERLKFLMDK